VGRRGSRQYCHVSKMTFKITTSGLPAELASVANPQACVARCPSTFMRASQCGGSPSMCMEDCRQKRKSALVLRSSSIPRSPSQVCRARASAACPRTNKRSTRAPVSCVRLSDKLGVRVRMKRAAPRSWYCSFAALSSPIATHCRATAAAICGDKKGM
jgi:hypothetical protein